jgi:hypothetical protein
MSQTVPSSPAGGKLMRASPYDPFEASSKSPKSPIIHPRVLSGILRPRRSAFALLCNHEPNLPAIVLPAPASASRNRAMSLGASALLGPSVAIGQDVELPNSGTITPYDVLCILGLVSEPRRSTLRTPEILQLDPSVRHDPSPKIRSARFPQMPESITGMIFLQKPWHFHSDVLYCQSTSDALEGYNKGTFEVLISAGDIVEDTIGLRWTSNGKYVLFRHNDDNPELCNNHQASLKSPHRAFYAHELFSQPKTPTANLTIDSSHPTQLPTPTTQTPLYRRRILKTRPSGPPHQPLSFPWTFPESALYIEGTPCSTFLTPLSAIEADVTSGSLIVNDVGIRIPHTTRYTLLYIGERDDKERFYTKRITRVEVDRPATPIVDAVMENSRGGDSTPKSARFNAKFEGVDGDGQRWEGRVVDNEGKSDDMYGVEERVKMSGRSTGRIRGRRLRRGIIRWHGV